MMFTMSDAQAVPRPYTMAETPAGAVTGMQRKPPAVTAIERALTPQEMQIVNYHRDTMRSGKVGRDPEGRPVTVYSVTIPVLDGPFKGQFATVPGYFNGRINGDDAAYTRWRDEIAAGKWPLYADPRVADDRAKFIHGVMDAESP